MAVLPPRATCAQAPFGTLRGVVVDDRTGEPLPTARVELLGHHRQEQTHADGSFTFARLTPGRYTLVIQRIGYRIVTRDVLVPAGEVTERVALVAAAVQLTPTVVTGTLRERAGEDVLSPTSVLSGEQLDGRLTGTVAGTLAAEPGVSVTSLSPATARPVIRGLGGDRIVVLEDGQRPGDLSAMSSDHAVAIEPLTARKIEVVRGPMSLLYGSSALGGVINVIRDEIPTSLPDRLHGVVSAQAATVAPGGTIGAAAHAQVAGLAWRLEGSGRGQGDVRTPVGTLINTDVRTFDGALGVGLVGDHGHGGASYRFYQNDYGIPGGFVGAHPTGVDIHMRRHTARGELERHLEGAGISTVRLGAAFTDYFHTELEPSGSIGTLFRQRVAALDAMAQHEALGPFRLGAVGLRGQFRDLKTGGSLSTPSTYDMNGAGFVVEELGSDRVRLQAGARLDWARFVPRDSTAFVGVGGQRLPVHPRTFGAVSASLGVRYVARPGVVLGVSLARAFRTPDVTELYSNGPHLAANSYDVGDPDLRSETGYGVDVFLRVSTQRLQGQAAVFGNWLMDYIFPSSRGRVDLGPQGSRPRFQYTNEDARFIGAEGAVTLAVTPQLVLEGSVSHVVARFTAPRDSIPVVTPDTSFVPASVYPPLIPPLHGRVGFRYERARWFISAGVQIAAAQERLGDFETRTGGYAIGDGAVGVRLLSGGRLHSLTVRIDNAANRTYRDHLSRVKAIMPEPGRNVSLLYRLTF